MPKKTRNRQLARQHQRRMSERMQQHRKRRLTTIAVALVIALLGSIGLVLVFTGGTEEQPAASGASGSIAPTGPSGAGEQTGTVKPELGPAEVACGGQVPEDALKPKPQFSAPAQVLDPIYRYRAVITTSCGEIVIDLFDDQAPQTVNSFVFLAKKGYFDGQRFHRLDTSIDVIQGGDPTGTGQGGPGYSIPDELTGSELYAPGVVAMANAGPDTGGSQFFIVTGKDGHLLDDQGAWTIFGSVVQGLDVVRTIQQLPVQDPSGGLSGQQPAQAVYIEKVEIREID